MKIKKKYDGGGMFETSRATQRKLRRAAKKSEKRKKRRQDIIDEGTPSNPRFMIGAPTRVNGAVPKKTEEKKKKKPKVVNRGKARGGIKKIGFGKGRRTSDSCRN